MIPYNYFVFPLISELSNYASLFIIDNAIFCIFFVYCYNLYLIPKNDYFKKIELFWIYAIN